MQTTSASFAGSSFSALITLAALLLAWVPTVATVLLSSVDVRAANFIGLAGCIGAALTYTVWEWHARPTLRDK